MSCTPRGNLPVLLPTSPSLPAESWRQHEDPGLHPNFRTRRRLRRMMARMTAAHAVDQQREYQAQKAGEAWGRGASDWSCLWEHYSFAVLIAMFGELGIGADIELLDIACGAGLAVRL